MSDQQWIARCIALAEKGRGSVSPNPLVGACVVKSGRLVAEGYHAKFGGPHAEVVALRKAGSRAGGATLYVSLEPCSTIGKTPACTDAILKSGVRQVVIGALDPNPKHFRKGIAILKKSGLRAKSGILAKKVRHQNKSFFSYHEKKRPFVIVKIAESLDGKITTRAHSREWISGLRARKWTHKLREEVDAVLVGTLTVKIDDPRMTPYLLQQGVRPLAGARGLTPCSRRKPIRIVLDRKLELSRSFKVFNDEAETIVFTSEKRPDAKRVAYSKSRCVTVFPVKEIKGQLNVREILRTLYSLGITSLLIEGGGELIASFFETRAVDRVYMFIAPFILGGRTTITSVEGIGVQKVNEAIRLENVKTSKIGEDLLVEGYVHGNR